MRAIAIGICILLIPLALFAQSDRGTITGTVSDPEGAVVPAAAIEAKNVSSGTIYQTATTNTGNYTIPQLPPGAYEIAVTAPGFKRYVRGPITVAVAQTLRIDVALEIGGVTEIVTVQAEGSLLKTESGDISHNVTLERMDTLPILGIGTSAAGGSGIRNPENILQLIPGTYYTPALNMKVNGAPNNSNNVRLDGQDATNQMMSFQPQMNQASVDAIQEVSVQTSNFAPEYGQVGGGLINQTTKSGTNEFHGSAYDYFVNEVLNAGTPFTSDGKGGLIRPPQRRNDYGFTLGGPVWIPKLYNGHDKTFFFFNFEQFREFSLINNQFVTVPTPAYRNGDFSQAMAAVGNKVVGTDQLGRPIIQNQIYDPATERTVNGFVVRDPFPDNKIPLDRMDPVAVKVQALIPLPTIPNALINNAVYPYIADRVTSIPGIKIDHSLSTKAKLAFYWSRTGTFAANSQFQQNADGLPAPISASRSTGITAHTTRLNFDYSLKPTVLLHLGGGYQQIRFISDGVMTDYDAEKELGLKGATLKHGFPDFQGLCQQPVPLGSVFGCLGQGGMQILGPLGTANLGMYVNKLQKPTANANVTWVRTNHAYKFGAEFRTEGYINQPWSNTNGNYAFAQAQTGLPSAASLPLSNQPGFNYASFLLGMVNNVTIAPANEKVRLGKQLWGLYVQDSWKPTRKLSIDYGLRWDYATYLREEYGRQPELGMNVPNPTAGGLPGGVIFEATCNCNFATNYPYAFGPRLGIAYQITPKTVFRGGWGLIYSSTGNQATTTQYSAISVSNPAPGEPIMTLQGGIPSQFTPKWPNFDPGLYPTTAAALSPAPLLLDHSAGRPARQNQWSIGLQREITRNLVVEAAYVGNRGVWWPAGLSSVNLITPQILAAHGLSLSNPADVTLLGSLLSSPVAIARGFGTPPFSGFPLTATVAQSLRPFPQFNGNIAASAAPVGNTWYDSLQAKVTKRFSHGLALTSVFTWAKSQGLGVDATINNLLNRPVNKSISSFDQPFVFATSATYMLPKLNINRAASWALRDWQIGAFLQYASGLPILAPAATNALSTVLFQGTYAMRVPGVPLFLQDENCHCFDPNATFLLNPAAWSQPAAGQFGTGSVFYSDYRYQRHPNESMNLARIFRIKENVNLQIRMEFQNVFNRTVLPNPTATNAAAPQTRNTAGKATSGFGWINTTSPGLPRQGTLVARFTF
jgi:hypothetical protein